MSAWLAALVFLLGAGEAPEHPQISVYRAGSQLYLRAGRERLLLTESEQWLSSVFGPNEVSLQGRRKLKAVDPTTGGFRRLILETAGTRARELRIDEVLEGWLERDDLWGGHQAANQMRYMHRSAGGISGRLLNITPAGASAFALINWHAMGPSFEPIYAQHLVRIQTAPKLRIQPIRPLGPKRGEVGQAAEEGCYYPRLFLWSRKPLIFEFGKIAEMLPDGGQGSIVGAVGSGYGPLGLLADRWLLLAKQEEREPHPFRLFDLKTKNESVLPGDWQGFFSDDYVYLPPKGNRFLVYRLDPEPERFKRSRTYVVTVPSGRHVSLPNPSGSVRHYLWRGFAIIVDETHVNVYDAVTGRRMRRLPIPGQSPVPRG